MTMLYPNPLEAGVRLRGKLRYIKATGHSGGVELKHTHRPREDTALARALCLSPGLIHESLPLGRLGEVAVFLNAPFSTKDDQTYKATRKEGPFKGVQKPTSRVQRPLGLSWQTL